MLLGDLIASFDEQKAAETLFLLDDLALVAQVQKKSAREEMSVGEFVRRAIEHYANSASDEEWVTVIGQMGQAKEPPGLILLRRALHKYH